MIPLLFDVATLLCLLLVFRLVKVFAQHEMQLRELEKDSEALADTVEILLEVEEERENEAERQAARDAGRTQL